MWNLKQIVTDYAIRREPIINAQKRHNFAVGPIPAWLAHLSGGGDVTLPESPKYIDVVVRPGQYLGQWDAVDVPGDDLYSRKGIIAMLSDEFAEQNNGADMLAKMNSQQLAEAGLTYNPPTVPASESFGLDHGGGIVGFKGNHEQFPPRGTQATNPANNTLYTFYSRLGGPGIVGYWVLPALYEEWTRYE